MTKERESGSRGLGPGGWKHKTQSDLIEVGILCGCQSKTLLMALEGQQIGQQTGSDLDILAKVVISMASDLTESLSQPLGLHGI